MKVNNLIQKIQTMSSSANDRYEGRAIYPTFAFMSHSCNPNARTVIQVGGHFHQRISFFFVMKNSLSYFHQTLRFLLYFFKQTFGKSERVIIAFIISRRMAQWKCTLRGKLKRATRWFVHDLGILSMGSVNAKRNI